MYLKQKLQEKIQHLEATKNEVARLSEALKNADDQVKVLFGECKMLTELIKEQEKKEQPEQTSEVKVAI